YCMRSSTVLTGVRTRAAAARRKAALSPLVSPAEVTAPAILTAPLKLVRHGSIDQPLWANQTELAAVSLPGRRGESLKRRVSPASCGHRGRRSCHGCPRAQERTAQPRYYI